MKFNFPGNVMISNVRIENLKNIQLFDVRSGVFMNINGGSISNSYIDV